MALKYYNNLPTPRSASSTEDSPTLVQTHPIPSTSQISNFRPTTAAESRGSRGIKRTRSLSADSTDEEEYSWRINRGNGRNVDPSQKGARNALDALQRMPTRNPPKRRRLDSPERLIINSLSTQTLRPNQPGGDSDEEDDYESDMPASEHSRGSTAGPKNIGNASSPSEYSNMNSLLRALHLNREWQTTKRQQDQRVETSGNAYNHTDDKHTSSQSTTNSQSPRIEIGESEKHTVRQIYEETNRALGRLMLSRHQPLQGTTGSDQGSDESDSDSTTEEDL